MNIQQPSERPNKQNKTQKFKSIKYGKNKLKYNLKLLKYGSVLCRLENTKILCGEKIFIQSTKNRILETEDLKKFKDVGEGEIIGVFRNYLIYRKNDSINIYDGNISVELDFYLEDGKLKYRPPLISKHNIIETISIYQNNLMVTIGRNVLFVDFLENIDIQYVFPGKISNISRLMIGSREFVQIDYFRGNNGASCLLYNNAIVSENMKIIFEDNIIRIIDYHGIKKYAHDLENILKINEPRASFPGLENRIEIENRSINTNLYNISYDIFENLVQFSQNSQLNIKNKCEKASIENNLFNAKNQYDTRVLLVDSYDTSHKSNNMLFRDNHNSGYQDFHSHESWNSQSAKIELDSKYFHANIGSAEIQIINLLSNRAIVVFMKALFSKNIPEILKLSLEVLIYKLGNTQKIFESCNFVRMLPGLDALVNNSNDLFFYIDPIQAATKSVNVVDMISINDFIDLKYTRLFRYHEGIEKSKNLAYKIIRYEEMHTREHLKNEEYTFDHLYFRKKIFKTFKLFFGDTRINDILDMMLENDISLSSDLHDTGHYRQTCFLMRSNCNIGAFLMNSNMFYCADFYKNSSTINNQKIDDKIQKYFHFINGACLFSYYKQSNMGQYYNLGTVFGKGLVNGISDNQLQQYIKDINENNSQTIQYLLLIISTRSANQPHGMNASINTLIMNYIDTEDISLKQSALCALAIYNRNTHNLNIIDFFLKECAKYGPLSLDKNVSFYDLKYRQLAALCCVIVSNKPINIELNDSFCKLLINGLTYINCNFLTTEFERTDECIPQEIFYSQLFKLTLDFKVPIIDIIENFHIKSCRTIPDICRLSAKIFYVSLKFLQDPIEDQKLYNWLLSTIETVEEVCNDFPSLKLLFNFCIISLSIIKNGTGDLNILRILRRQLVKTKYIKDMKIFDLFDPIKKDKTSWKGSDFESIQIYKLCIGLVLANFGLGQLKLDIKQLIISFFITNQLSFEFSHFDILKLLIVKSITTNHKSKENFDKLTIDVIISEKRKKLKKYFLKRFNQLSTLDKKVCVDILSDYYENFFKFSKKEIIFDMEILANLVSISK